MIEEYISAKDRILAASIDILSEGGLISLKFPIIAMRTNIREDMLYRYYPNVEDILSDIVDYYFKFDKGLFKTIESKDCSYMDKIYIFNDSLALYYENYSSLSAVMLQYEELLHNIELREKVMNGYIKRRMFVCDLFKNAIDNGEIVPTFTPDELTDMLFGVVHMNLLNRRLFRPKKSFKEEIRTITDKMVGRLFEK